MKTFFIAFLLIAFGLLFSGCIARLFMLGEVEMIAARTMVRGGATEGALAGNMTRMARMGITTERIGVFSRTTAQISNGRLLTAEEVAFNSELGSIRMYRSSSGNPRLYFRGANEPFGEVIPGSGHIRLFDGQLISPRQNFYSVNHGGVHIRSAPNFTRGSIIGQLEEGSVVVKLFREGDWYWIRTVQNGRELTGWVMMGLIVPFFLVDPDEDEEPISADEALEHEERYRWDYYRSTMESKQIRATEALTLLASLFESDFSDAKHYYNLENWPKQMLKFVRITTTSLPILNKPEFSKGIEVLGMGLAGEVLQFVEELKVSTKINNPLKWGPKNYGDWYKVKTPSGVSGWIFAKPNELGENLATLEIRCDPSSIKLICESSNPYEVYINGNHFLTIQGNSVEWISGLPKDNYTVKVIQKSGYLFWATEKSFEISLDCNSTRSVYFP